jgi:hypothetical protein
MFENLEHGSIYDANDPSLKYLKMLEESFVWEARSLYLIAVGGIVWIIYRPAGPAVALFLALGIAMTVRASMYFFLHFTVDRNPLGIVPCSNLTTGATPGSHATFLGYNHRQPNLTFLRVTSAFA